MEIFAGGEFQTIGALRAGACRWRLSCLSSFRSGQASNRSCEG